MRHRLAVVAAALLGGWSSVAAQSPSPPPTFSASVVVTASLEPQLEEDLAATVDVVDATEIEQRQAELVVDLLRELPGLAVVQSGSPGKVASLFTRGTNSSHTRVLLDGVTLNDPVLGAFDWSTATTDGLDRIEVARGPFSALWGSSAVGGVIQLIPRRGRERRGSVRIEAGSSAYRRGGFHLALPTGALSFDLSGHLRRGDGELANDFFDSGGGMLRAEARLPEGWRLGLLARATDSEIGLPFDFASNPTPSRRQASNSKLAALPVDAVVGVWQLELRLARGESHLEVEDPDDAFAANGAKTRRDQARGVVTRSFGDALWVAGGAEWERETASTSSAFGPGLDDARQSSRALFVQSSWAARRLRLELGARRDQNSAFGSETSLRAGAVVKMGDGARLRTSYGESYRAPSLGDLYFPGFGNPELEAERGASWEVGFELDRGPFEARVVGFHNDLDELIQFDFATFLPFNIGHARTRGIEAGFGARSAAWRARADVTWLEAEDRTTGTPLPRRPEWSGAVGIEWSGARASAAARVRAAGAREDVGRVALGAYSILDLSTAVDWSHGVAPYARVENALGERYEEAVGYPAPGRAWIVGVGWRSSR